MIFAPQLVAAIVKARDINSPENYEELLAEIERIRPSSHQPLLDVLDATAACLAPLSGDGDPSMVRRANFRVLVARIDAYRRAVGADENTAFIFALFAADGLFTEADREMSGAS